ncbi:hypothetical protein U1Q18_027508, partial [Sarracenia purpurea var. burkii]
RREKEYAHSECHRDPEGDDNAREGPPVKLLPPESQVRLGPDDFIDKDVDTDESEEREKREGL